MTTGLYNIDIVATSTGTLTYTIIIDNGVSIRNLVIKNEGSASTIVVVEVVTLGRVETVRTHEDSTGEVWISEVNATAGIGAPSSPFGEIAVDKIGSLNTAGDITADITVYGATGESMSMGSITCDGSLLGVLDVRGGDAGSIVVGEDFVSLTNTSVVHGDLDSIVVDGIFLTPISVNTLRRLDAGQFGFDDLYIAQLNVGQIGGENAGVFIHGDWVSGSIAVALSALTVPIEVDGCFGCPDENNATLELLTFEDFQSQVIFNKANTGGTWGTTAKICFDKDEFGLCDASITEPYYTLTDIEAGSIGLAPFRLHDEACSPVNDDVQYFPVSLDLSGSCLDQCDSFGVADSVPDDVAVIRHYGPVQWASGDPLTVKRRSLACGGSETWTNVTSSFDFEIKAGSGDREIEVTYTGYGAPYWPIDYEYRIEPVAGVLKCKNVTGNPDVADYDYEFTLIADCVESFMAHYDQNDDEALCGLDLVTWSASPVDLNGDTVADGADLSDLWEVVQTHGD